VALVFVMLGVWGTNASPTFAQSSSGKLDAVTALLPTVPPPGFGLGDGATFTGTGEVNVMAGARPSVAEFLDEQSLTATRVWADAAGSIAVAVSITKYPYGIFAATALGAIDTLDDWNVVSTDAIRDVPDVVSYVGSGDRAGRVAVAFRRGRLYVIVVGARAASTPAARVEALVAGMTRVAASGLPSGASSANDLPKTPSTLAGLALTAALVTIGVGSSTSVARVRARRVRRRWRGGRLPAPVAGGHGPTGAAVSLDDAAAELRRSGLVVAGAQLLAVNVIVVALAGDFRWVGVIVASAALVAGLAVTRWWQGRELALLGAHAPPRDLVLPRPLGAVMLLVSLAVLALGVAYLLKGVRYLVLPASLAQLHWSVLLGIAPRTVGIVFAVGGFAVAVLGGALFRVARALSRAGAARVLAADRRPPALYLRSFDDDSLPLPTIASARRPLFEVLSLRGADPFEESVAWELSSYGPVVAVGRPGRSLASLGAAREHLSEATWQEQVARRMEQAAVIAVATGETDGLAWEVGQLVKGGHLAKTFFVFPPAQPESLDRRWAHTAASLVQSGATVGPLPVPVTLVHTVRIGPDGTANVTFASRRDEATYRTAVDRALVS
jgi:hypothetical protein